MMEKQQKRLIALEKELRAASLREKKYVKEMRERGVAPGGWKQKLESRIPERVRTGLESAFAKAFSLVFTRGRGVIELGYNKESILEDHAILDFAFRTKCGRRELREIGRSANRGNYRNMALTTAEGIGLGALGIGLPDLVIFIGVLLRGVYETALRYGYDYESRTEQLLILCMMQASLSSGEEFERLHREIGERIAEPQSEVTEADFEEQIRKTAKTFATDMLLLKFIQGLPVVGILGGAANPVYYKKVLHYVQMCYHKRYLQKLYWEQDSSAYEEGNEA